MSTNLGYMQLDSVSAQKLIAMVTNACIRPRLMVGYDAFNSVACFLDGYVAGLTDSAISDEHWGNNVLQEHFQKFLAAKYGPETYQRVTWSEIYRNRFPSRSDKENLKQLLEDFNDFLNPLIRLAVEV